jgi:hypothetical protein
MTDHGITFFISIRWAGTVRSTCSLHSRDRLIRPKVRRLRSARRALDAAREQSEMIPAMALRHPRTPRLPVVPITPHGLPSVSPDAPARVPRETPPLPQIRPYNA